jgi:diguanylate cyclase (GGDEF)-like protein
MVWVCALSCVYVPVSYLIVPSVVGFTAIVGFLLVPGLNLCGYLVWRKPRSDFAEGLSVFLIISAMMIAFGLLGVAAGGSNYERSLTGIFYVSTAAIVVINISYGWSMALMVACASIYCGFEIFNPEISLRTALGTSSFYTMAAYAITLTRKVQLTLSRRAFLMSLRDHYRREQLEILATLDPLTGLANRRSADAMIERLWNDRGIPKASIAFFMADIDSFKQLNDTVGHAAGDQCLQVIAQTIKESLRLDSDAVFRFGGEEFLIVLTNTTPDRAWALAERIRGAVERLAIANPGIHNASGPDGVVTISLGVAFAREDVAPEHVAKWADEALYDAKRSGRNVTFLSNGQVGDLACDETETRSHSGINVAAGEDRKK